MIDDESAVRELGARIDDLETAVRDLRHAVSELGRRLAMDLPQVLARHRDAIVDALAPAPSPAQSQPPAVEAGGSTAGAPAGATNPDAAGRAVVDPERGPDPGLEPDAADTVRSRRALRRRRGVTS